MTRFYTLPILLIATITGISGFAGFDLPEKENVPIVIFLLAANLFIVSLFVKFLLKRRDTSNRLKPLRIK